ncbi:spermidine/putrescine transport system substrate-binding protein [Rhodoligotrophos appendicifer]|uniref:ABC transporter substrate-binding protein n=1 Tax=Rhodoligotrophos appendicifer TaxID=987056 RepID=UPI001FE290E0|nr:extracellular solute-binding protein [Rhodoligotrophos appendicifer]
MVRWRDCQSRLAGMALGLAVLGLTGLSGSVAVQADEIHVLNWKGWGTDEAFALEAFEKQTGTKVVHDYITSYPEVFSKLQTNPGYYDVVVLNAAFVGKAVEEGLIEPIDTSKLSNFADLYPDMRDAPALNIDGKVYGVAWIWGGTSVTYDTTVFTTPPTSLEVLWDPKHAGRVCWRDDPEDSVRFTALALGQNPDKPSDMDAIREKLRALKAQIKSFWKSEDEWRKLVAAKECDLSIFWTSSAEKAVIEDKLPVSYIVAKEGAIGFRDGLVVPKDAPNEKGAYAFINYLISPEFYAGWVKAGGAPVSANAKALEGLPASSLTRQVLSTPENLKRINFKGPISDEQRQDYLDLWQETKAYFAQ